MTHRYCTSCQCDRQTEGGEYRKLNKTARWLCRLCVQRKSVSLYKSQRPSTLAEVNRLLDQISHRRL